MSAPFLCRLVVLTRPEAEFLCDHAYANNYLATIKASPYSQGQWYEVEIHSLDQYEGERTLISLRSGEQPPWTGWGSDE